MDITMHGYGSLTSIGMRLIADSSAEMLAQNTKPWASSHAAL